MKKSMFALFLVASIAAHSQYLVRQQVDAYTLTINGTPTKIPFIKPELTEIDFSKAAYVNGIATVLPAGIGISLEESLVFVSDASKADVFVGTSNGKDYFVFRSGQIKCLDNSRYFLNFYDLLRRFQAQGATVFSVPLNEANELKTYLFEKNGRYLFLKVISYESGNASLWMAYK
jgi:hypothetical protein